MSSHGDDRQARTRRVGSVVAVAMALISYAIVVGGPAADARQGAGNERSRQTVRQIAADHDEASRGRIVWSQFTALDFSGARIVSSDPNGGHVRVLTHPGDGVHDVDPQVSPNGRLVAFERDVPDPTYGDVANVVIVGANGRGEHVVDLGCVDPCLGTNQPTWTLDGRHLVFSRVVGPIDSHGNAASAALWRTDVDGEHITRVTPRRLDGRMEDSWAQFAPDGYMVVLRLRIATDQTAIFRMTPDGNDACRLTPWQLNADLMDVSPATTGPTHNVVVFETHGHGGAPPGQSQAVATASATCHGDHEIRYLTSPTSPPVENFNPAWSPDGRQVTYVRFKFVDTDPIVHGDIWRMRWNGEDKRPVSQLDLFEFRPNWGPSPDDDD